MRVELRLYASLGRFMPGRNAVTPRPVEVAEGSTIRDLLESLRVPMNAVKLIFLNGVHADGGEVLKEGDRVGVFPPVAGG